MLCGLKVIDRYNKKKYLYIKLGLVFKEVYPFPLPFSELSINY